MAVRLQALCAAAFVLLVGASVSGCLTVYPAKNILSTDPRESSLTFANVRAYNRSEDAGAGSNSILTCTGGSDTRLVYVPPKSQWVDVGVNAQLKAVPEPGTQFANQHFDLTVKDGGGVTWVDIHLQGNDTMKKIHIEGPRPGAWSLDLSWNLCKIPPPINIDDHFDVEVVVRQPA